VGFIFSPPNHFLFFSFYDLPLLLIFKEAIEIQLNCEEGLKECTIERSLLSSFGFVFIFSPLFLLSYFIKSL